MPGSGGVPYSHFLERRRIASHRTDGHLRRAWHALSRLRRRRRGLDRRLLEPELESCRSSFKRTFRLTASRFIVGRPSLSNGVLKSNANGLASLSCRNSCLATASIQVGT